MTQTDRVRAWREANREKQRATDRRLNEKRKAWRLELKKLRQENEELRRRLAIATARQSSLPLGTLGPLPVRR